MSTLLPRIDGLRFDGPRICDLWLVDGLRVGEGGPDAGEGLGKWPAELDTDSFVRLSEALGAEPDWQALAATPAVAQKLSERARPQPLDRHIGAYLHHLQHVSYRPRMHLRVEEERVPVSRARRTPVRAVADLVSHPADWEHRTLRSIQPARVLARLIEDEWNLYENRVAARLVDHLLAYLARRLEELLKIEEALQTSRDHGDEAKTSFWRARRIMSLWAETLDSKTEEDLKRTIRQVERAQRELQSLLDSPLYRHIPRRATVPVSLRPTNILVNDPHYRKVAALWRAWAKYGHKRQETRRERLERRQREAGAWDQFVYHLVVRAFAGLGWTVRLAGGGTRLSKPGWRDVELSQSEVGLVHCRSVGEGSDLTLLPACASFAVEESEPVTDALSQLGCSAGEVVLAHVGEPLPAGESDTASGWSFAGKPVLLGCSPWSIDSEERAARLIGGWVSRACSMPYPVSAEAPALPSPPSWDWLQHRPPHAVALRPPRADEARGVQSWLEERRREQTQKALFAKKAKLAYELAPGKALDALEELARRAALDLRHLGDCPVCREQGVVQPRSGRGDDGSDSTWWAMCGNCGSEWGLRPCSSCGARFMELQPVTGVDASKVTTRVQPHLWPDKVFGRDVWAQPCSREGETQFRCPSCGDCGGGGCGRCE